MAKPLEFNVADLIPQITDPQVRNALSKCASLMPFGRFGGGFGSGSGGTSGNSNGTSSNGTKSTT